MVTTLIIITMEVGKRVITYSSSGLAADIGLTVGKTLTGYLSGSTAIVADAAHSLSDVVLSGVALWSFKAAKAPKDEEILMTLTFIIAVLLHFTYGLYWITKRDGEKEGSGLMKANAWHHRADAVSSMIALIGVGGAMIGVPFLDPLAGLVVSGMILKAGI